MWDTATGSLDGLAGTGALLMAVGFVGIRRRPLFFLLYGALLAAALSWRAWAVGDAAARGELPAFAVALLLFGFGLLFVRVMLLRSVSLALLEGCASGRSAAGEEGLLSRRLDEALRLGLVERQKGLFRATAPGRLLARVVGVFDRLTGAAP